MMQRDDRAPGCPWRELRVGWRTTLALAWLCVSAPVTFAAEGPTDGRKLLTYCEEAEKDNSKLNPFLVGYCMAFIEGTLRGWEASSQVRDLPYGYCISPGVTIGQMTAIVVKHLRADPTRLSGNAETLVITAFQKTCPCAPGQQKR